MPENATWVLCDANTEELYPSSVDKNEQLIDVLLASVNSRAWKSGHTLNHVKWVKWSETITSKHECSPIPRILELVHVEDLQATDPVSRRVDICARFRAQKLEHRFQHLDLPVELLLIEPSEADLCLELCQSA